MLGDLMRGFTTAVLNFLKGLWREPTKAVDSDDTSDLRDRIRDRVRRAKGGPGSPNGGPPSGA